MKKIIALFIIIGLQIVGVFGEIATFEAGLVEEETLKKNIYNYTEVIFITGEPIVLKGTVTMPKDKGSDKKSYNLSYKYDLKNVEKGATLTRTITYKVNKEKKKNQTVVDVEISKLDEKINIGGEAYILDSFQFNKSKIEDNTPSVDYHSGNLYLKRIYYLGTPIENKGKVTTTITSKGDEGAMIGYHHFWGNAETYISKMTILSEKEETWEGFVDIKISDQTFSTFKYQSTAPENISFTGSYVRQDKVENVLQYTYDLPDLSDKTKRNKGEETLRNDKIVDGTSMIIPYFKDIAGHWAENDIFLLASLEIIDNETEYFDPNNYLTRIEFAKMISNAIADIETRTKSDYIRDLRPGKKQMFYDIPKDYKDYNYVKFVYDNGIMIGASDFFNPDSKITRAEVITIIIRALGLVNRAPQLPFETRYDDDKNIPTWAKRSVYMADEVGIIEGYPDYTIRPQKFVTKAEGARIIKSLIDLMKDNIRIDYREKIINRY